jgi:hypothetical protein
MFGRWLIFLVSILITAFVAFAVAFSLSGTFSFCSEPAKGLGLLDQFCCSRYAKWVVSVACTIFVVGPGVFMAPACKRTCGVVLTFLVAFVASAILGPDMDLPTLDYAQFICSISAGCLITYLLRKQDAQFA